MFPVFPPKAETGFRADTCEFVMSTQQARHMRVLSGISDDTILASPSTVHSQAGILEAVAQEDMTEKAREYDSLNSHSSPYNFPSRDHNGSSITQYDNGVAIEHMSPSATKNPSPRVTKMSSQVTFANSDEEKPARRLSSVQGSWKPEILSLISAVVAIVAMLVLLAHFNGRALPLWPTTFVTLNAVVAVLVTIAAAGVGIPLSNGLSQLKWIRMRTREGAPLADMDTFDTASRGAMGSFGLLVRGRGG